MKQRVLRILVLSMAPLVMSASFAAQTQPPAKDNTRQNQRDRAPGQPTADQAKNNLNDREVMQKIRKSVMDDKSLSTYAHNVKIISENGMVTLKGPVRSDQEKREVEQKAAEVAGAAKVKSEITVQPPKQK